MAGRKEANMTNKKRIQELATQVAALEKEVQTGKTAVWAGAGIMGVELLVWGARKAFGKSPKTETVETTVEVETEKAEAPKAGAEATTSSSEGGDEDEE